MGSPHPSLEYRTLSVADRLRRAAGAIPALRGSHHSRRVASRSSNALGVGLVDITPERCKSALMMCYTMDTVLWIMVLVSSTAPCQRHRRPCF